MTIIFHCSISKKRLMSMKLIEFTSLFISYTILTESKLSNIYF